MTTASTALPIPFREHRVLQWSTAAVLTSAALAGLSPVSRVNWVLENTLVLAFIAALAWTYRWLPLSGTSYTLLAAFLCLHEVGAHYSYYQTPFGHWLKPWFVTDRNDFDRVVHFSYGLLCAYPFQELAMRTGIRSAWRSLVPIALVLAFSAGYEMMEAAVAGLAPAELGDDFSGLQGDPWDAQKDMFVASIGSVFTMVAVAYARHRRAQVRQPEAAMAMTARAK